ncbi:NAD(P)H-binding protein [Rhizobium sp. KVB221]|uniref:NAD(P)H-binding protein n=1 Tax=Rhizobium setariae TaxID=2801340 RepID=A0A936YVW9_9HYPH|nr:NAD(P)H-binding protein [Rhizobium setariae]MBL0374956.1 NAD(P)H-binding protein [Rhizobium setariae]
MRVAILGANGRVSNAVAGAFLAAGHDVIAVTRSGACKGLTCKVSFRAADASSAEQLIAATAGADLIFNGLNPPYDQWAAKAMPMASNVIAAAKAHGIPHLFIGNVYNFGHAIPVDAGPETRQSAETRKGRIRIEMERSFEQAARNNGVKTIILRAGDFYGTPGTGSWFDLFMIKGVDKGTFVWPGRDDIPHAFAYLPDLANAFVALAERIDGLPAFDSFTFEGHTLSGSAFKRAVEKATGRGMKLGSVPWWMFRLVSPFYGMAREVLEMRYLWNTPHSLSGGKFKALMGELSQTPADLAICNALRDQGKSIA